MSGSGILRPWRRPEHPFQSPESKEWLVGKIHQRSLIGALFVLTMPVASAPAQMKTALGKPEAEYREGFTRVAGIRELPNRKVLVVDPSDKVVQLVDLATGSAVKVGREGSGPGEYALPMSLLALPDGSTLIQDLLNRRFLTVSPEGKPGGFVELPRPPAAPQGAGPGPGMMIGGMDMRGTDAKGRLYFQGSPFTPGAPPPDSVPILRWDRVGPGFDTVGYLRLPPRSVQTSGGPGRMEVRVGGQKVFTPAEAWAVAGDGRVARVQPAPYRVIWLEGPGRVTPGPVQPYTPIRVTEADKQLVREARKKSPGLMISMGPGERSVSTAPPSGMPEPEFEETMPPFAAGPGAGGPVLVTPEGEVWVLRTRPASDKIPSYDVFDRTGALVKKITLSPNSRVVGFGNGMLYVVRTDEDDLQYLQQYKRP